MGFLDRFKFRTNTEDNLFSKVLFSSLSSGQVVWTDTNNQKYVSEFFEKNADLYAIIDYITKGFNRVNMVVKNKSDDIVERGELYDLINNPNPSQALDEWAAVYLAFKLVTGNSYVWGVGAGKRYKELWQLPAQYTEIVSGGWAKPVRSYKVNIANGWSKEFPVEEVLHVKNVNLEYANNGFLYGMSPLKPGGFVVDTSLSAQEASASKLQNKGAEKLISVEGVEGTQMGKKFSANLKKQVKDSIDGTNNRGSVAVTGKKVQVHDLSQSSADLGIDNAQSRTLHQLCNLYHVPPVLLDPNVGNTYNNIREAHKAFYTEAVIPEVQQFCTDFNRWIGDMFGGEYIDYDTSGIEALRADYDQHKDKMTPNEVRELILNLPRIEDPEMDVVWQPANMVPTGTDIDDDAIKGVNDYK